MNAQKARVRNTELTRQSRDIAAELGELWYKIISKRWYKDWGYEHLEDAIREECERGLSSVEACVANYKFYVVDNGYSMDQFIQVVGDLGTYKLTEARTVAAIDPQILLATSEKIRLKRLKEIENEMALLSLDGAINRRRQATGEADHFRKRLMLWFVDESTYQIVMQAIEHIRARAGDQLQLTPTSAIGYLAGEYLTEHGTRLIEVKKEEAEDATV